MNKKLDKVLECLTEAIEAIREETSAEEEKSTVTSGVYVHPGDIMVKNDKRNERFVVVTTDTYVRGNTQYGKERTNDLPATPYIPMYNESAGKFRWTRQIDRYLKLDPNGTYAPVIGFRE